MDPRARHADRARRPRWARTLGVLAAVSVAGIGAGGVAFGSEPFSTTTPTAAFTAPSVAAPSEADAVLRDALSDLGPALTSRGANVRATPRATDVPDALSQLTPALAAAGDFDEELRAEQLAHLGGVLTEEVDFVGSGELTVVPGEMAAPNPELRTFTILVRVEEGIGIDPDVFTEQVFEILEDPRGWGPIDGVSFARTSTPEEADVTLTLASPATTQELCGELPTGGYTSCGRVGSVNINAARWAHNADAFLAAGGSDQEYRAYLINHEVGHVLDHWHVPCTGAGDLAPVMLQQTLRLDGCVPNGWPNPDA